MQLQLCEWYGHHGDSVYTTACYRPAEYVCLVYKVEKTWYLCGPHADKSVQNLMWKILPDKVPMLNGKKCRRGT